MGEGVEVVVGGVVDAVHHLPVVGGGGLVLVPIELDRSAEEEGVAVKVRVEERLVGVEELQGVLEEVQGLGVVVQRIGIQRLQGQGLGGDVVVL